MRERIMANDESNNKVTIFIDDVPFKVSADNNLLAGVLSNKLNLPYFCWHPSMGSVGACRQCAVTQYMDEHDTRGRTVMSCMTPVTDGMRIGLNDGSSTKFREQVIAAMMTNHPHDCPVCAEGGECHLQDMTVMTGHSSRQYRGEKRTFTNQYLGELVGHEMNRCITCYRCVRFYKDYAGGKDFDVFGSRNQVYFGRQKDGVLESQFSGNLVEVCPTGVFTNKLFSAHYSRKWDLQSAPSVCAHCSVGCNTSIGERYGSVRRVMNRYNHDLNGYFLCDRGRFGIGFVNSSDRINTVSGINCKAGEPLQGTFNEKSFAKVMALHHSENFIGIGSARASFEANRLLKYLVGKENFSLGYTNLEMQLSLRHKQLLAQYPQQSLAGIENRVQHGNGNKEHDLVLIIGEVIEQTAPRLALTIKQVLRNAALDKAESIGVKHWQDSAVRTYAGNASTPLFSLQAQPSEFDQGANGALVLSPDKIIACVNQLTSMLKDDFSLKDIVVTLHESTASTTKVPVEKTQLDIDDHGVCEKDSVEQANTNHQDKCLLLLARSLSQAKMPLIVTGLTLKSPALLVAIDELMACLSQKSHGVSPELTVVAPECNSVGNLHFFSEQALSIEQVINRCKTDKEVPTSLIILEQDLAQLSKGQKNQLRQHCETMIVLEHTKSELTELADLVLPVATVSESNGHFVNFQGRLQPFVSAHKTVKPIMENWYWLGLLAKHLCGHDEVSFENLVQLQSFFAKHGEPWALQVLASQQNSQKSKNSVARQTHRASGRTALMANQSVHESKTYRENYNNQDGFNYSMEGEEASSSNHMPYIWSPAWNSNQAIFQHQQEVGGELVNSTRENILNLTLSVYFDESPQLSVSEKLNSLWPVIMEQTLDSLTLIQNIPWFLAEQQTRRVPEFILMFSGNKVWLSTAFAQQHDIQSMDVIKLNVSGEEFFATVKISEKQQDNIVLVSLYELPLTTNNLTIEKNSISKATLDEVENFIELETARKNAAQKEKVSVLARLKKQDQHIPITFYQNMGEHNG